MRDWDRNGKIDGRDHYLFHEEILKDHSASDNESSCTSGNSSYRRSKTNQADNNEQKELGCLPILLVNVVLLALLEILKSL